MYVFPQVILNSKGFSYLGAAHRISGNDHSHLILKDRLHTIQNSTTTNKYWVYELVSGKLVLRAAQPTIEGAIHFFNEGDNSNRVIVHTDKFFLSIPKTK